MQSHLYEKIIIGIMYITIVILALVSYQTSPVWMYDCLAMIFLIVILTLVYKPLHINHAILTFCFIAIMFHMLGLFGFYSSEPLGLRYDHYVHFFGGMAVCMIAYNYLERYHSNKKFKNIHRPAVILLSIFVAMGLGGIIEMTEYVGWYVYGEGEGLFLLGAGDYEGASGNPREWINSSLDQIFNAIGAIFGAILMSLKVKWMDKKDHFGL